MTNENVVVQINEKNGLKYSTRPEYFLCLSSKHIRGQKWSGKMVKLKARHQRNVVKDEKKQNKYDKRKEEKNSQ